MARSTVARCVLILASRGLASLHAGANLMGCPPVCYSYISCCPVVRALALSTHTPSQLYKLVAMSAYPADHTHVYTRLGFVAGL